MSPIRRLGTVLLSAALTAQLVTARAPGNAAPGGVEGPRWEDLEYDRSLELQYAQQFSVDYYQDGYSLVEIQEVGTYLVAPPKAAVPSGLDEGITVLRQPLDRIYLAATSAMDLFRELDSLAAIRLSGTKAQDWYVEEARAAMEAGEILYAGKYSAPDYERIYAEGCDLAVESTMIYHTPEVKEQLEELGVPVLVERSSYEGHPLGRMEWLKLYGVLLGKEDQAQERFQQTLDRLAPVLDQEGTGKTVAFFYITSNGGVNVRKPGDYISKLIGMAGGEYVFQDLGGEENALSTMNLQMEAFYAGAKDADLLIYTSAVDGGLRTLDELLEKNGVLAEFRAVQEGNVWCTGQDLFQSSMGLGDLLLDIHTVLTQEDPEPESLTYLYRLTKEG